MKSYVVGVDGGGTKTDIVLCDTDGNILSRVITNPCNPIDIGVENCLDVIRRGIESTDNAAFVSSIFAGISGGITGGNKELIARGLKKRFPDMVTDNHTDAVCALNSGIYLDDGAVVISGTGSVGYCRRGDDFVRVGGYGYLFDKGGSGYDFGRDAFYYALCDLDKRGKSTLITQLIMEKTGDILRNLDSIYKKGKTYIASFAPVVFEAYKAGDEVALEIVESNAKEYAKIFNTLAKICGNDKCKTVLAGSMWNDFDIIYPHAKKYLESEFEFIKPEVPPVYGALIAAANNIGKLSEKFKTNLKKEFEKL